MNKQNTLLAAFALVLVLVVIVIITVIFSSNNAPQEDTQSPTPTTVVVETNTKPPISYNQTRQDELIDKIENRIELSASDVQATEAIISTLPQGQTSGTIHETGTFRIDYLASPNVFQVEIFVIEIMTAKNEATNWFLDQGLSYEAICNYPVHFYLNYDVAQGLNGQGIVFSPLAQEC